MLLSSCQHTRFWIRVSCPPSQSAALKLRIFAFAFRIWSELMDRTWGLCEGICLRSWGLRETASVRAREGGRGRGRERDSSRCSRGLGPWRPTDGRFWWTEWRATRTALRPCTSWRSFAHWSGLRLWTLFESFWTGSSSAWTTGAPSSSKRFDLLL